MLALVSTPVFAQEIPEPSNEIGQNFKCYDIKELDLWLNNNDYYPVFYWKDQLYDNSNAFWWYNSTENVLVIAIVPEQDKSLACTVTVSNQIFVNNEGFERFIRDYLQNRTKKEAT